MRGPEKIYEVFDTVSGGDITTRQFSQNGFAVGGSTVQKRLFPIPHASRNLSRGTITPKGERHDAFLGPAIKMLRRFREMRIARRFHATDSTSCREVNSVEKCVLPQYVRALRYC